MKILNVFQPGLIRGSAHLPYDPEKAYAYVEHPTEGWRVYLRTAVFLHSREESFQEDKFLVCRNAKKGAKSNTWDVPKGQMEGKDLKKDGPLLTYLAESARRETAEEARIETIVNFIYTGLVFQSQEKAYPKNWFFQYHMFQGFVSNRTLNETIEKFAWLQEHPKAFARLSRDKRETDAIDWFQPKKTPLNKRWVPTIVYSYMREGNKFPPYPRH